MFYDKAELQKTEYQDVVDVHGNVVCPGKIVEEENVVPLFEESCEEALRLVQSTPKYNETAAMLGIMARTVSHNGRVFGYYTGKKD